MNASLFPSSQVKTLRRSKRLGLWLLVMLGCLAVAGCVRRVPEIHGQVVDVRDGNPIAGAVVVRRLYKPGRFDLVDTQAPVRVRESVFKTATDAEGRFAFPAFSRFGQITGMGWVVFKPGFVPASGCVGRASWGSGGCSGFGSFMPPDPWSQTSFADGENGLTLDVRLFPPTTDGISWTGSITWREYNPTTGKHDIEKHFPEDVDPWGEYFRRLNVLTGEGWLPVSTFVEEALGHLERGGQLSEVTAREFLETVDYFYLPGGSVTERDARALVAAVEALCKHGCGDQLRRYLALLIRKISDRSPGGAQ